MDITAQDLIFQRMPSSEALKGEVRRHRGLVVCLAVVLLCIGADSDVEPLLTQQPPGPTEVRRVAMAHPWRLSSAPPDRRDYSDTIANGEHLRERAAVADAAQATLQRARADAAAAVAGQPSALVAAGTAPPGVAVPNANRAVLPAIGVFTSGFGQRWGSMHRGIDIAGPIGTPIYAVAEGTVIDAGPAQGFGLWVRIRHDDGMISVYGHLYDYFVSVGERVPAGLQIARMGNRGDSTGPHLHFEIIGADGQIDPTRWLAMHGLSYAQ